MSPLFRIPTSFLIGLTAIVLVLSSCVKKPEACFQNSAIVIKKNEKLLFDASCSTNANVFSWDFGDGTKGAGQTTDKSYIFAGTYEVTLTVYSRGGQSDVNEQKVLIEE
jgi:PKD repeat protein